MTSECSQRWYLSQSPWFQHEHIGTRILAGSADPHVGVVIIDTLMYDPLDEDKSLQRARDIATLIVNNHNSALDYDKRMKIEEGK